MNVMYPRALLLVTLLGTAACAGFKPLPEAEIPAFRDRAENASIADLDVSVVVLTKDEAKAVYGKDVYKRDMQPVWIRVRNDSDKPCRLMQVALDHDYFSPAEAAWVCKGGMSKGKKKAMYLHFRDLGFESRVEPGETHEGFVLTHRDAGYKFVQVDLLSYEQLVSFPFEVTVSGLNADLSRVDMDALRANREEVTTLEELRERLEAIAPCATNANGTKEGDPINFFVIGPTGRSLLPFVRRGWHMTQPTTASSSMKTAWSAVAGSRYRYSPVSSLYLFDRHQDMAAQKARGSINRRNHFRVWIAPFTFRGLDVAVCQVSRDIGVRGTTKTWSFTTHKIDPDVDETRDYVLQEMFYSRRLEAVGWIDGGHVAPAEDPRPNLTGDPWFSDGRRFVAFLGEDLLEDGECDSVDWLRSFKEFNAGPEDEK